MQFGCKNNEGFHTFLSIFGSATIMNPTKAEKIASKCSLYKKKKKKFLNNFRNSKFKLQVYHQTDVGCTSKV